MDFTPNNTTTTTTTTITQTPPIQSTNGAVKRHHPNPPPPVTPPPQAAAASYKECLKNHAASIGGHALDGCGEFMPSAASDHCDPRSLKCAACGCHRNFHRREPNDSHSQNPNFLTCFYPPPLAHRGLSPSTTSPSPSPSPSRSSPSPSPLSSPSPPPVSHFPPPSYHTTSAPHVLLALGNAYSRPSDENHHRHHHHHRSFGNFPAKENKNNNSSGSGRKRFRTKFSQEQKEKMQSFSEKLGWRMQKGDDRAIQDFCNEVGVSRGVFKVWMHNNKNNFRKRSSVLR